MEPFGLAAGVLSLAGLFNNALDCFDYIQLGRNFDKDFQTHLLRLDDARLRLSRWGTSVGLGGDLKDLSAGQSTFRAADVEEAGSRLKQILGLFQDAERTSNGLKVQVKGKHDSLTVLDPNDLDAPTVNLHNRIRAIAHRRGNKLSLQQRVKWALYEEKHFKKMIEDITNLVNGLIGLFPAAEPAQEALCNAEVSEMGAESLPTLKNAIVGQDGHLEAAILKVLREAPAQPSNFVSSGNNNSGLQMLDNKGSMSNMSFERKNG